MKAFEASGVPCRLRTRILPFFIFIVLTSGVGGMQYASAQTTGQSAHTVTTDPLHLNQYIAACYSIFGPARLASLTSQSLVFPGELGNPGVTISLANKTVSVMNEAGASLPFSTLGHGVSVIVCYRSDSVVVFALQSVSTGASNVRYQ